MCIRDRIHTDDLLSIIVSCDDLESAQPFNTPMIGLGREVNTTSSQQIPRGYLVDKNGEIDFPVLGKLLSLINIYGAFYHAIGSRRRC